MFLVNDTIENRRRKILSFIESGESVIAVILAAANFEWTVRRVIIGLGTSTNDKFKGDAGLFRKVSGLDGYKRLWKSEIPSARLAELIQNWKYFKEDAFPLRHRLVHGVTGTTGVDYAKKRVLSMLDASEALVVFAKSNGIDIFKKLKVKKGSDKSL